MPASISDLPEELLAIIFELAIEAARGQHTGWRTKFALVSRRWNAIVCNTPSLWTSVTGPGPAPIALTLARSGNQALDITIALGPSTESWEDVCGHLHRWGTAFISLREADSKLLQYLSAPAPRLETVHIVVVAPERGTRLDLFSGQAARLRSIRLQALSIPWTSRILRGLTVLRLDHIGHHTPTLMDIITVLRASPQLSVLRLGSVRFTVPGPSTASSPIDLPCLTSLELSWLPSYVIIPLLEIIHSPPCQTLTVQCDFEQNPSNTIPTIVPFLPKSISGDAVFVDMRIDQDCMDYQLCHPDNSIITPSLTFCFYTVHVDAILPPFISVLPPEYRLLNTKVKLYQDRSPSLLPWLGKLNVTGIAVEDNGPLVDDLLRALSQSFPALQTLSVFCSNEVHLDLLVGAVEARCTESGFAPFTSLKIRGSKRREDVEAALTRRLGDDVLHWEEWDLDDEYAEEREALPVALQNRTSCCIVA